MTDLPFDEGGLCLIPSEEGIPRALLPLDLPENYLREARFLKNSGALLKGVWGATSERPSVYAAFLLKEGLVVLSLFLSPDTLSFPSLSGLFPAAGRFERMVRDLFGFLPVGLSDLRPQTDHGLWARPPLSNPNIPVAHLQPSSPPGDYPFVRVAGEGVHEIPVGPVHAGIIEPGHFRFSVVGEKVLRLETRMGYTHKGIASLFRGRTISEGARLASRISGDSAVAYSLVFSQAVEQATGIAPSEGSRFVRAILLERERIANHLGDLGSLGNDAGLGAALSLFGRLRESLHRTSLTFFGHRLLFDSVVPGGASSGLSVSAVEHLLGECDFLTRELSQLERIYADHGGLQDRFQNTGILSPEVAHLYGVGGVAGRASGQAFDARVDHRGDPTHRFAPALSLDHTGDVAARVRIRFLEIFESLLFTRSLLLHLPEPPLTMALPDIPEPREGCALVEGFRGEVIGWVRLLPGGVIESAHIQDPSPLLWHALEAATPGNLAADFPLINKSFNPSYSGTDL